MADGQGTVRTAIAAASRKVACEQRAVSIRGDLIDAAVASAYEEGRKLAVDLAQVPPRQPEHARSAPPDPFPSQKPVIGCVR
jgi:hypothetical protein